MHIKRRFIRRRKRLNKTILFEVNALDSCEKTDETKNYNRKQLFTVKNKSTGKNKSITSLKITK